MNQLMDKNCYNYIKDKRIAWKELKAWKKKKKLKVKMKITKAKIIRVIVVLSIVKDEFLFQKLIYY